MRMSPHRGAMALLCSVALVAGCGDEENDSAATSSGKKFAGRTLTVASPGGDLTKAETEAYYKPFEAATGATVKVVETDYGTIPSLLKSTVKAGRAPWDLVSSVDAVTMNSLAEQSLIQKIDTTGVPGIDQLDPQYVDDYGVTTEVDAVVPAYTEAEGAKALPDTAAFFDSDAYPGDRAAAGPNTQNGTIMCALALHADGVAAEDLVPLDIDRCLKVWDRVKPSIKVWWGSGSEMAQNMLDGNMDYCICYDGRVQQVRRSDPAWSYNLKDALSVTAWIIQPTGSENQDMIRELLRFFMDPEREAVFVEGIGYSTANPNVEKHLPEELKQYLSTSAANFPQLLKLTPEQTVELAASSEEVERRWSEWTGQ